MAKAKKQKKQKVSRGLDMAANVKVVGVGGGGGNIVERISRNFPRGADFIAINTDHQDLDHCSVRQKIYIGRNLTRGLGTGMNPDLGRQAAEENRSEIAESLRGADLIFIAFGAGGGTGCGAAPVVAEVAQQTGALTIAMVTRPFAFEGSQRERIAQEGIVKIKDKVDALIVVPNDRIFTVISKDTPILKAFEAIDDVLRGALRGMVDIIAAPGIINIDFADVRTVVQNAGAAIAAVGFGSGPERATVAVNSAMNSPLLETSAEGAKSVLLGIAGGRDLKMSEINEAAKIVAQMADPGARIIFGAYHDRSLRPKQVKVTLVAAGFNGASRSQLFPNGDTRQNQFAAEKSAVYPQKSGKVAPAPKAHEAVRHEETAEMEAKPKQQEIKKEIKKESDIWDVPAFLRRRKK